MAQDAAALLEAIAQEKANAKIIEANIRAEYEDKIRMSVAGAWQNVEDVMAAAYSAGISLRQIGMAYGSSNFRTIKALVTAGLERAALLAGTDTAQAPATPDQPQHAKNARPKRSPGSDLRAYVTVQDGRYVATDVPPDAWTYDPTAPYAPPRPTQPWSGWLAVDATAREPVLDNYLLAEVKFGTGLRDLLDPAVQAR